MTYKENKICPQDKAQFCLEWCKNHGFPTKVVNGYVVYWQTNIQTAEYHCDTDKLLWWGRDYFDQVESN